jgi:hypothetical protein
MERYLDVMTFSSSRTSNYASTENAKKLFVEPVCFPNMKHLDIDRTQDAQEACLFYPTGRKSRKLKSDMESLVRKIDKFELGDSGKKANGGKGGTRSRTTSDSLDSESYEPINVPTNIVIPKRHNKVSPLPTFDESDGNSSVSTSSSNVLREGSQRSLEESQRSARRSYIGISPRQSEATPRISVAPQSIGTGRFSINDRIPDPYGNDKKKEFQKHFHHDYKYNRKEDRGTKELLQRIRANERNIMRITYPTF